MATTLNFPANRNHTYPSNTSTFYILSEDYIFWTLYGVVGLGIVFGNSFTMTVFLSSYNLRHTYMNIFLVSLAGSDIMMAVLVLPGFASFCSKENWRETTECHVLEGPKDFVFLLSVFNLLAITYDRYLAVLKPLHYYRKLTRSRLKSILLVVWILPLPLTVMRNIVQAIFGPPEAKEVLKIYDSILVSCVVLLPIVIMLVINLKIVKAIRRQKVRIHVQPSNSDMTFTENGLKSGVNSPRPSDYRSVTPLDLPKTPQLELKVPEVPTKKRRNSSVRFRGNSERKGTMTCLFIVLAFVVFWLPRAFYNFFDTFGRDDLNTETFTKTSYLCMFTQSLVNPFIYSFYRKDFKLAAKKLLKCAK